MNISGQGTHMLDYAMSLNGDAHVLRVFGAVSGAEGMGEIHPAPDTSVGQVLFANGVYGAWNNGPTAPRAGDESTVWQHCRVAAYAERGHVLWEEFGKWEVVSPDGTEEGRIADMQDWMAGNHAAQAALTEAMFDWIEDDDRPAGTNLKLGLHQWQAVLALYASALWRKPVELPFDPPDDLFPQLAQALR
jgi:predicted dehydrogenase